MIEKAKLYGILIWYNPTSEHVTNINSYFNEINTLIIIDNSSTGNSSLLFDFDQSKIIYIANNENKGIATELNRACKIAIELGAVWVLTMDQDSYFTDNNSKQFIENANDYPDFGKVAIFTPYHFDSRNNNQKQIFNNRYSQTNYAMTSGNILSLEKLQSVGFFLEELFIDWVDEEICIKISKFHWQIIIVNETCIEHFVGKGTKKTMFFGKIKYFDDYDPMRYYYITRNVFIVSKLHPSESSRLIKRWGKIVRKTIMYDNIYKLLKIKYIIFGLFDYFMGITGSYNEK